MKVVLQRVSKASVRIANKTVAAIEQGFMILVGIEEADTQEDIIWLSKKIINLRVFSDVEGKMNLALKDIDGNLIVVSQFTLHAGTKKGNRPSYIKAAKPDIAIPLYEAFVSQLEEDFGKEVQTGEFGANMLLDICNDGPVTIIIDSKNKE